MCCYTAQVPAAAGAGPGCGQMLEAKVDLAGPPMWVVAETHILKPSLQAPT